MQRLRWGALAVIAVIAIAQLLFYFPRTVDDMFIFLRYAENAAAGHGLVYNIGERVEGFSSVTWVALLTIGAVVGANLVTFSKLLAIASVVGLLTGQYALTRDLLRRDDPPKWHALLPFVPPAVTACCSYVMSWAMLGLETPLFLALLVWSAVVFGRYVEAPSRRRLIAAGVVGGAFALSRPEAPMLIAAIAAGLVVTARRPELRDRIRVTAIVVAPSAGIFIAYSLFRRLYFGLWFPHTYYVKSGDGLNRLGLRQLVGDGATFFEIAFVFGGLALAIYALWRRRDAIVLAVALVNIVFVATVAVDWMPNVRFWLPLWVVLPMIWTWGAAELTARGKHWRYAGAACALVIAGTAFQQLQIDMRYSIFSYQARGSKSWVKPKDGEMIHDTWRALTREWPPSIAKEHELEHGMNTQVYRLIESDARPLEDTWFLGADIGLVGYATPVNVWELPGLFTPDIRPYREQLARRILPPELVDAMVARPVAMSEIFDKLWSDAIKKHGVYSKRFEPTNGWSYIRERGAAKPTKEQILERYHAAEAKLPSSYFLMHLHGTPLGAQFDRRIRIVESK